MDIKSSNYLTGLTHKESVRGYLKEYDKEVLIIRRVFASKDRSIGILNFDLMKKTGVQFITFYDN